MTKSIFLSKTFWANFIVAVLASLEVAGVIDYLTPEYQAAGAIVIAALNLILRYVTVAPVHITSPKNEVS